MIISPPFLPDPIAKETDENFVTRAMTTEATGKFPVSSYMQWHGGVHLQAPTADTSVRAIADDKIVYLRQPTEKPTDIADLKQHPLYVPDIGWTDNGCIIIRHQTEIGEEITITYYSIYMHLKSIETDLLQGNNIHRKTKLGKADQIYGQNNLIHFEIIAADDQIENIIGSLTLNKNGANYYTDQQNHINHYISQHGRTKSCFGSMYFYLPANTPTYTKTNSNILGTNNNTLGQALYLEMKYHTGNCTFTTYDENGTQIGQPVTTQPSATTNSNNSSGGIHEYNLYDQALQVCQAMPTAGFELLRFGRVLGTEALNPPNTKHFREIPTANGNTWVDLNTDEIKKYSDADFPFWKGWNIAADDTNIDSRCDSSIVSTILDTGREPGSFANSAEADRKKLLSEEAIKKKLEKIFYKFPTEWQNADFEKRYNWIKDPKDQGGWALTDEDFKKYQSHVQAQTFWEEANIGIEANHWHCPPIEFIKHFRQCGWLSQSELKQIIPIEVLRAEYGRNSRGQRFVKQLDWEHVPKNGGALIPLHYKSLNKMMRKYCINTPLRMASFLANSIQETKWFSSLEEEMNPTSLPNYYPWHGRGFLQLTGPGNYASYWKFRGRQIVSSFQKFIQNFKTNNHSDASNPSFGQYFTWRDQLAAPDNTTESLFAPSDSAGLYWASQSPNMNKLADNPHAIDRIQVSAVEKQNSGQYVSVGQKIYYRSRSFWQVSAQINLPTSINTFYSLYLNGFEQRCSVYGYAIAILTEIRFPDQQQNLTVEFPEGYHRRPI